MLPAVADAKASCSRHLFECTKIYYQHLYRQLLAQVLRVEITCLTMKETGDSIANIWGKRTPYFEEWPVRVDKRIAEEPDKWVHSACVLCYNGCGLENRVKDNKIVGARVAPTTR